MRIAIAKSDRFSAEAIQQVALKTFPGAVVSLHHTGACVLSTLRAAPAQIGVFGLTLPDMDGLDLLHQIIEERLARRRLVLSWRRDARTWQTLRALDIHGHCDAERDGIETLAKALMRVASGGTHFESRVGHASQRAAPRAFGGEIGHVSAALMLDLRGKLRAGVEIAGPRRVELFVGLEFQGELRAEYQVGPIVRYGALPVGGEREDIVRQAWDF